MSTRRAEAAPLLDPARSSRAVRSIAPGQPLPPCLPDGLYYFGCRCSRGGLRRPRHVLLDVPAAGQPLSPGRGHPRLDAPGPASRSALIPRCGSLACPARDIEAFLARPQTGLADADAQALAEAFKRLTGQLDPALDRGQVLHGDAGAGNLMATGAGWIWHDFEDMCSGPITWDLAPSVASRFMDGSRVLAAYGGQRRRPPVRCLPALRTSHSRTRHHDTARHHSRHAVTVQADFEENSASRLTRTAKRTRSARSATP
ncbi:MAG: phosphotransferase [Streptosporangiaceae bacterium]